MSDDVPKTTEGLIAIMTFPTPRPAPVIDTAEVRRTLAESLLLSDHTGTERVFSMMRALLDEIDRLDGRVKELEKALPEQISDLRDEINGTGMHDPNW